MTTIHELALEQGTIRCRDSGDGPPVVFVHGALVDGDLWREVGALLDSEHRVIVPDLPLGAHRVPMLRGADLSPPGLARMIDGLMAALGLEDVTLVGNDTGGALCQIVATRHPDRLAGLVLTNCDAFENFLPPAFAYLQVAARIPGALAVLAQSMRLRPLRRTPIAYGWLTKRRIDDERIGAWVEPLISDPAIRRDAGAVLRGISKRHTLDAAAQLASFDRPALIAWAPEDRFFSWSYAERLAATIPGARLERIEDARTFVSLDQPERLAELIAGFVAGEVRAHRDRTRT